MVVNSLLIDGWLVADYPNPWNLNMRELPDSIIFTIESPRRTIVQAQSRQLQSKLGQIFWVMVGRLLLHGIPWLQKD